MFDPVLLIVAVTAVFLVGLSKSGLVMGLSVIGVPLLTLVMPAREAAGVMLPLLLVMDVIAVYTYRRDVVWKVFWFLLPGAILGTLLAWWLSAMVSEAAVRLAIGIISLLFVLDAWFPLRKKLANLPPSRVWGTFWGAISGFTSFISHTGGPPVQIYMLPLGLRPTLVAGTASVYFAVINTLKLLPYFTLGQLSTSNMGLSALLVPAAVIGMLVGVYLVRRISTGIFYTLAYWAIFLLSLKLIWDGAFGLFT